MTTKTKTTKRRGGCWRLGHENAERERSLLDIPLYPVRCDHCGHLFYMIDEAAERHLHKRVIADTEARGER